MTLQQTVFDTLPPASRCGHGITTREIAERTGLRESQVRAALWRLNRCSLAFCFDRDERNSCIWERTRAA